MRTSRALAAILAVAALGGCVTPRLYSEAELSALGRKCGLAEGEVLQEAEEPRLLFLFRPGASRAERVCVARWSKRHGLHMAYVEAVQVKPE